MTWRTCFLVSGFSLTSVMAQDADGDGLPDTWEQANGSDSGVANADADFDRDHVTASEEAVHGLTPLGQWKATAIPSSGGIPIETLIEMNSQGNVAFTSRHIPPLNGRLFHTWLYRATNPGTLTSIPDFAFVYDMNDDEEIVGANFGNGTTGRLYQPWSGTQEYNIGFIDHTYSSSASTYPLRINNLGEITGSHNGLVFYQNFLGLIDAYEDDPYDFEFEDPNLQSFGFTDINDAGTLLGTYALGGVPKAFLYQQSDPTIPGYFFWTDFPSEFPTLPPGANYNPNDDDPADIDIESVVPAGLNDYGEFAGAYRAEGSAPANQGYRGIHYFDGEFSWDLIDPTILDENDNAPSVLGINDWPQMIYSYQAANGPYTSHLYHDHVKASPEDLPITNPAGGTRNFLSGARFITLSNHGHVLVKGKLPGDTADHLYVLELDHDSDSDGLPDDWEMANNVSDASANPDGDQFSNYEEFIYNLDPNVSDVVTDSGSLSLTGGPGLAGNDLDGDGIPNTVETLWGLNRDDDTDAALDADGDGLSNLAEFLAGTSAISMDTDRDGVIDSEELENGTDPRQSDIAQPLTTSSLVMLTPLQ